MGDLDNFYYVYTISRAGVANPEHIEEPGKKVLISTSQGPLCLLLIHFEGQSSVL